MKNCLSLKWVGIRIAMVVTLRYGSGLFLEITNGRCWNMYINRNRLSMTLFGYFMIFGEGFKTEEDFSYEMKESSL